MARMARISLVSPSNARANAVMGLTLAALASNSKATSIRAKVLEAIANWRWYKELPSTLESLVAMRLMVWHGDNDGMTGSMLRYLESALPIDSYEPPYSRLPRTIDAKVVAGFVLSQGGFYDNAREILYASLAKIRLRYGLTSLEYGITVAELTNCCNILRDEESAEKHAMDALEIRSAGFDIDEEDIGDRPDWSYLCIGLADSFIGRVKYDQAIDVLRSILENPAVSSEVARVTALRLAKCERRRFEGRTAGIDFIDPLEQATMHFAHSSDVLKSEYLEELACNMALLSEGDTAQRYRLQAFVAYVDSVLLHESPQSSLLLTPAGQNVTRVRKQGFDVEKTEEHERNLIGTEAIACPSDSLREGNLSNLMHPFDRDPDVNPPDYAPIDET
jgi:hypothetical protein